MFPQYTERAQYADPSFHTPENMLSASLNYLCEAFSSRAQLQARDEGRCSEMPCGGPVLPLQRSYRVQGNQLWLAP